MVENRMYPDGMDQNYVRIPVQQIRYGHEFPSECRVFSVHFKKLDPKATSPTRNHLTDAGMDLYALQDVVVPSLIKAAWGSMKKHVLLYINYVLASILGEAQNTKQPIEHDDFVHENVGATKIKTGIALEIPAGMYGLILDRSSMGSKLLKGLAGVIDSGYRGDVTVCLANLSFHDYHIKAGDKIAQIVFHKYEALQPVEVDELNDADRGEKGFGSSGA